MNLSDRLLSTPAGKLWKGIGIKHHHGINIPLFSLVTERSSGIGEYTDLIPMMDFCKEIGFDIIQLLPLNDTGLDVSPYNALSAFALNPLHISLRSLPDVESIGDFSLKMEILKKYNQTPRVRYDIVRELKNEFLREYFQLFFPQISSSASYQQFVSQNNWLKPYALFIAIKERMGYTSWETWESPWKNPSKEGFEALFKEFEKEMHFPIFLQYFALQQMESVKRYANEKGVFLKGDIPILISRDSADVWFHKHLFFLHLAAGSPPDMYAQEGQYWGFPVYNWEAMEKENFAFWRERIALASRFYNLYRLDHVVGFYRMWAIPTGKEGLEGSFLPQDENAWLPQGEKILKILLESGAALPIAEDLGIVPPKVRDSLKHLGISGTKVIRWERRWEEDRSFIPYQDYIPESMTTVSTHDSETLILWWRHNPKDAKEFCTFKKWDYKPFLTLEREYEILKDSHHSSSLFHINLLSEYLALFQELVTTNPYEERINIPGKILPTNWTFRFRHPLEKIASHSILKKTMREIVEK